MITRWGLQVDPKAPLPEHPRPQLVRPDWVNLNGPWSYAFTRSEAPPARWTGEIIVPFSPETELSGVGQQLLPDDWLWYQRNVEIEAQPGKRLLLHFGAVDQICTVWVNDVEVGSHVGGYLPFSFDITDQMADSSLSIRVRVQDFSETHFHARGKQRLDRGQIWYTAQSGIWQTVWLEWVPEVHITELLFTPKLAEESVEVTISATADTDARLVIDQTEHTLSTNQATLLPLSEVRLWSPTEPSLYDVHVTLPESADAVSSYFAMREFGIDHSQQPPGLTLNGEPITHVGLLDQGYWPESLLTPPSDEAMVFDITTAKELGYNMLRKHVKIEQLRWYHHCDRLGILVWQDLVNGGGRYRSLVANLPARLPLKINDRHHRLYFRDDEAGRSQFLSEVDQTVRLLRNVPSICVWVPFNEGWGQFNANAVADRVKALDPSRLVNHVSGWVDQGGGDIRSFHRYLGKFKMPRRLDRRRAVALTEYGGYSVKVAGHDWSQDEFGYQHFEDLPTFEQAFLELLDHLDEPVAAGLSTLVYTQLTDVEDELNGLLTYDREVLKLSPDAAALARGKHERWACD